MGLAFFRFYAELNDFLPLDRRQIEFAHCFEDRASIKDMIESLGVPHTEVDLILVGGESVDFSYIVKDKDRISVYPVFESIDISSLVRLRPHPLREIRFVLDNHLGKLASYLRLLGFDTAYRNNYSDTDLALLSSNENRILLTRDRGLLKRSMVTYGYCVRDTDPERQLIEVIRRFDLSHVCSPFNRCLSCNALLEPVSKEAISDRLPPKVRQHYDEFHICRTCDRVYWKGSHYERMQQFISEILGRVTQGENLPQYYSAD
jgi:uncharacterized protein with PIN domain